MSHEEGVLCTGPTACRDCDRPLRAGDADAKAEKAIKDSEGTFERNDKAPGKPIIKVTLSGPRVSDA